ncbi:MAG: hypothetical protein EHM61_12365 [Acidobacteria bacterium]|nr:MAG: hypothetical protein EHM61_12365 [Acidobacteriota bacterium]
MSSPGRPPISSAIALSCPPVASTVSVSAFREIHPETQVLYTSGYSGDVIANYGGCDAGQHIISKPFSMQALSDKVRSVLDLPNLP